MCLAHENPGCCLPTTFILETSHSFGNLCVWFVLRVYLGEYPTRFDVLHYIFHVCVFSHCRFLGIKSRPVGDNGDASAAIYSLKRVVLDVTRRLVADNNRLPLRNHTTAVLIDGSRMSLLALELAGACWKFGRCVDLEGGGVDATDRFVPFFCSSFYPRGPKPCFNWCLHCCV